MARRRGRSAGGEAGDSLDLLLDTICNTFGGVLFMAMLICLLTGKPRSALTPPADAESAARAQLAAMAAAERRERDEAAATLRAGRADLDRAEVDAQLAALATRIGSDVPTVTRLAERFAGRESEVRDALSARPQRAELARQAAVRREALAAARAAVARRSAEADAAAATAAEKRERSRIPLRVPTARVTNKRQAVAFVAGGRLFAGIYPDASYRGNVPAYRGSIPGGGTSVGPASLPPTLGSAAVDSLDVATAAMRDQGLAALDPGSAYVVFAVWPDSHAAFRLLRDAITSRGIGYGLILMGENESVRFGGSGDNYEQ